jgi:hypothetical protein
LFQFGVDFARLVLCITAELVEFALRLLSVRLGVLLELFAGAGEMRLDLG